MMKRTHDCGELRESNSGTRSFWRAGSTISGIRAKLAFIDLRDRGGITQIVFNLEDCDEQTVENAHSLRREDVIKGIQSRPNEKLSTGSIEVIGQTIEVLNSESTDSSR